MTKNYERFFSMIDRCPRIAGLWDRENRSLDVERFEKELKGLSGGEIHLAKFFAGVWLNDNRYNFDLIGAIHVLDANNKQLISDWIENPFFP